MGWAGGIVAAELTKAGLEVVGLERGPDYGAPPGRASGERDELRRRRYERMQDTARETWTLRHDQGEDALPMRYAGAFTPGNGVGGSSLLYGGHAGRLPPWEFAPHSTTVERYGAQAIPEETSLLDWGISYDDLEVYYDRFERVAGIGGQAGNLRGLIKPGGNSFEGPRSSEFPVPPPPEAAGPAVFREAAQRLGYHPYPVAAATLSQPYVNPDGIARSACTYCGFCVGYRCEIGAKADATVTVLPVALASGRLNLRSCAYVYRVVHDGHQARGVLYYDERGRAHEQPAAIVILAAYALGNVRLLLLSELGERYSADTGRGSVGRNYAFNFVFPTQALFGGRRFKNYMGSGATGSCIADFEADNFDHEGLDFLGGGLIWSCTVGAAPLAGIAVPPGTPTWGAVWKRATRDWYDRAVSVVAHGLGMPYASHYLDLDPTYRDAWGHPLLRMTFDWRENERRLYRFLRARISEIVTEMRPDHVVPAPQDLPARFDVSRYVCTHNTGGAIMGADASSSTVNPWLQMWAVDNVWVVGGSAMPQAPSTGPTGTICALAYRAAAGIVEHYVRSPGPLV
jgi:gluconate 2-dehydrogenase alpha chain